MNNKGVTGPFKPPQTDLEHVRVWPRNSACAFWTTTDTYTKYSTLPSGISAYIVPKVGIFPEAGGRGKYSLPRVQYMPILHKEGF